MSTDHPVTATKLARMSSEESAAFFAEISSKSRNDLVKFAWSVTYDPLGKDMYSVVDVTLVHEADALLQLWLRNSAGGIWIPEIQPWEASLVEFRPEQSVTSAKLGLLDSKWTGDDIGRRYQYQMWGYLLHDERVESFSAEKWGTYPGDAQDS